MNRAEEFKKRYSALAQYAGIWSYFVWDLPNGEVLTDINIRPDDVHISDIVVGEENRGKGLAGQVMREIVKIADDTGMPITLKVQPTGQAGGVKMTKAKLKKWYQSFGFEGNRGDYMVRPPKVRQGRKRNPKALCAKRCTVYHVGNLEKSRVKPGESLEGAGLSVSQHPDEWMKIARLGGGDVYTLTKPGARFLVWSKKNEAKALKWSVEHGYLEPRLKYRVCWWDDEWDDKMCMDFEDREAAEEEAENYEVEVAEVQGSVFGPKGREYWREAFTSEPNEGLARDFAIIFYAEDEGYDGVWWDEELDVSRLSAPRGVIFQSMLPTWEIERAPPKGTRRVTKKARTLAVNPSTNADLVGRLKF